MTDRGAGHIDIDTYEPSAKEAAVMEKYGHLIEKQNDPHADHCSYCRTFIGLFDTAQVETLTELEDVIVAGLAYRRLKKDGAIRG